MIIFDIQYKIIFWYNLIHKQVITIFFFFFPLGLLFMFILCCSVLKRRILKSDTASALLWLPSTLVLKVSLTFLSLPLIQSRWIPASLGICRYISFNCFYNHQVVAFTATKANMGELDAWAVLAQQHYSSEWETT